MSIELIIYLANILPGLSCLLFLFPIIFLAFVIVIFLNKKADAYTEKLNDDANSFFNFYFKKNIKWIISSLFLSFMIPSEKTIYLMLGANYLKNSTLPSKVEAAIEKKIDSYLNEDKENK